jgi:hypothetical protein
MTVYEMGQKMPMSEVNQWFEFYALKAEREKKAERGGSVNLLDLEPEALAKAFSGE